MSFSLDTLEYNKLLELVRRHAQTPMGVERLACLRPIENRLELDDALAAVTETIELNEKQVNWSFSGLDDPSDAVAILKIQNAALEPVVMLDLARVCTQALFVRAAIQSEKESAPILWQTVEQIPPSLLAVTEQISKKLLRGGEINDDASPELAKLRREINAQKARLTKSLESAMRAAGTAIQDEIVTVRNDRFVIPVKTDFRGKVAGVAHGFSSSGSTVFVEPLASIEANNELQNLKGKEEREVARSLFALTDAHSTADLDARLPRLLENRRQVWFPFATHAGLAARVEGWLNQVLARVRYGALCPQQQGGLCALLDEMRLIKDEHELAIMRRAGSISAGAHVRAMQTSARMLRAGQEVREYHLEAELLHEFRRHGSQYPAYGSIVAAGANACVLHYVANDKVLNDHTLVLI